MTFSVFKLAVIVSTNSNNYGTLLYEKTLKNFSNKSFIYLNPETFTYNTGLPNCLTEQSDISMFF